MKRILNILMLMFLSVEFALPIGTPAWVSKLPTSESKTYYYRVTKAEGKSYNEAYSRALSMALLESSWKIGATVKSDATEQTVEQTIEKTLNVENEALNIPINKVCEYETKTGPKVTLYVLWQVARDPNKDPHFEDFTNCE